MKLDFAALSRPESLQPTLEPWGQVGTAGTPALTRVAVRSGLGDRPGTGGDKGQAGAANDDAAAGAGGLLPVACPQVSQLCPHSTDAATPNEINLSPVSPVVPGAFAKDAMDDDSEREAFEERAAIMEFDGGMTRAEAEAAARALLRSDRSINARN